MPKILIAEDEALIAEYFRLIVEQLGYEVCGIAGTAEDVVRMALQEAPELVLMDVRLSGEKDGVDAANEIYKTRVIPIVYVTASRERTTSVRIRQDLPAEVLTKPVLARHLKAALDKYCPLPG